MGGVRGGGCTHRSPRSVFVAKGKWAFFPFNGHNRTRHKSSSGRERHVSTPIDNVFAKIDRRRMYPSQHPRSVPFRSVPYHSRVPVFHRHSAHHTVTCERTHFSKHSGASSQDTARRPTGGHAMPPFAVTQNIPSPGARLCPRRRRHVFTGRCRSHNNNN